MTLSQRIQTRPGYKFVAFILIIVACFSVIKYTEPVVIVNKDNMVISVDGKDTYRSLTNWDLRECKIIRK